MPPLATTTSSKLSDSRMSIDDRDSNIFNDEHHPARATSKKLPYYHPAKAIQELLAVKNGWRTSHYGIKHEEARLELVTWNGWLTCDFSSESIERFPLSLWERFRIGRMARKMSQSLIVNAMLPDGSSRTLHSALIESICLHPQEWEVCTDVIHHQASGVELVTRDGPFFLRCSPMSKEHFRIGILKRLSIWLGIKRLIRMTVAGRLQEVAEVMRNRSKVAVSP